MWVLYAPFDGEAQPSRALVLRSGRTYTVGRKAEAVDLYVPVPRISRIAGTLRLSAVGAAQAADATARAKVTWTMAERSKSGSLIEGMRGRNRIEQRVRPDMPIELHDHSRVCLVSGVALELKWEALVFSYHDIPKLETRSMQEAAAALGIHLLPALQPPTTHLVVRHARPNKTQLLALVRCMPIVTEAFVVAVMDAADMPTWRMPDPLAFQPLCDPALPPESRVSLQQWRPQPARQHIYAGQSLSMWIPRPARRYQDMASLAEAAGARVYVHDMSSEPVDLPRIRQILAGERQPQLFAVADQVPAVDEACRSLRIPVLEHGMSTITEGILDTQPWGSIHATDMASPEHEACPESVEMEESCREVTRFEPSSDIPTEATRSISSVDVTTSNTQRMPSVDGLSSEVMSPESHIVTKKSTSSATEPTHVSCAADSSIPASPVPLSSTPIPRRAQRITVDDVFAPLTQSERPTSRRVRSDLLDEVLGVPMGTSPPRRSAKYRRILDERSSQSASPTKEPTEPAQSAPPAQPAEASAAQEASTQHQTQKGSETFVPHDNPQQAPAAYASPPHSSPFGQIDRGSCMQVHFEHMARPSRTARDYKKFRAQRARPVHRVPLVIDAPEDEQALFFE